MDRDAEFLKMPTDFWVASAILALFFGILILGFTEIGAKRPITMPFANVYGCYSAQGGPDIMVQASALIVLQNPRILTHSKLKYAKGWIFEIGNWLNVSKIDSSHFVVESANPHGEFLTLSKEGQTPPAVAEFTLYSRGDMQEVTYQWVGSTCPQTQLHRQ